MEKQLITEKDGVHKEWYAQAKKTTLKELPSFIKHLLNDYGHDYGTIVHALSAGAIAAATAMNKDDSGGITGFQAGAVMWQFVTGWLYESNKCGLRMLDYDNMLYPQYEDKFDKQISSSTWTQIRREADARIKEADDAHAKYLTDIEKYKEEISAYRLKYPDYDSNPQHYEHLGMGTGAEWDAEKKKEASGFEFAPRKPYGGVSKDGEVYKHWTRLSEGVLPWGFKIGED